MLWRAFDVLWGSLAALGAVTAGTISVFFGAIMRATTKVGSSTNRPMFSGRALFTALLVQHEIVPFNWKSLGSSTKQIMLPIDRMDYGKSSTGIDVNHNLNLGVLSVFSAW